LEFKEEKGHGKKKEGRGEGRGNDVRLKWKESGRRCCYHLQGRHFAVGLSKDTRPEVRRRREKSISVGRGRRVFGQSLCQNEKDVASQIRDSSLKIQLYHHSESKSQGRSHKYLVMPLAPRDERLVHHCACKKVWGWESIGVQIVARGFHG
jgi:hypothetical protein